VDKFVDKNGRLFTPGCTFIKEVRGKQRTYMVHKMCATQTLPTFVVRALHCREIAPDLPYYKRTRITDLKNTIIIGETDGTKTSTKD